MRRRSSIATFALAGAALGLLAVSRSSPAAELGPDDPRLQAAARSVQTDPQQMRYYLGVARAQPEKVGAPILLLAGQYELGRGRFAAADRFFLQAIAVGGEGPWRPVAEVGLGWAALGRGDFAEARRHYVASGLADFGAILAVALIDAAAGDARAVTTLTPLADGDAPADLLDIARLALGYAQLWAGNGEAAQAVFASVADPPLLDDAAYASALIQARRGDVDDARTALTALADLESRAGAPHPSRALLELAPRAVVRGGLRRTRDAPITSQRDQLLTVLDGDGAALARAALQSGLVGRQHRANGAHADPSAPAAAARDAGTAVVPAAPEIPTHGAVPAPPPRRSARAAWAIVLLIAAAVWWIRRRSSVSRPTAPSLSPLRRSASGRSARA